MTNLEINQLLHKSVMGKRWIEENDLCHCPSCSNPSYTSSWEAYGRLLEVAMTKEWWLPFLGNRIEVYTHYEFDSTATYHKLLNPLLGSTAMAEFVKEKGI